ncbi:IS3 family transposase [Macrococcus hajekii]
MKKIFEENDGNYGYRRITGELREKTLSLKTA